MQRDQVPQVSETFQNEIEKCIECGSCLYSCPVYLECFDERHVPRGRNHLIRALGYGEKVFLEEATRELFDRCLLCGRCVSTCPRGVRNDLVVLRARAELVRTYGLPFTKSMTFRRLMADREAMKKAVRLASRFQWLLSSPEFAGEKTVKVPAKVRHIPLFFLGLGDSRQLPAIADRFLSETVPEENPASRKVVGRELRVAYFSGCATEFVLPQVGESLVRLLNLAGAAVLFPKHQGCCGLAVHANGDVDTAKAMALHNLEVMSSLDADLVVTGCATCGSALKDGWSNLFEGDSRQSLFLEFAKKVRDVSELLLELAEYKPVQYRSRLPSGIRVTYHDPCHLARHQGITEQPRTLLRQIFREDFIELDNKGCCGFGGSFGLYHYDLSSKIADDKILSINNTGADVVINTCPGCMMQLVDGIKRHHSGQKVLHLVEAIEPL